MWVEGDRLRATTEGRACAYDGASANAQDYLDTPLPSNTPQSPPGQTKAIHRLLRLAYFKLMLDRHSSHTTPPPPVRGLLVWLETAHGIRIERAKGYVMRRNCVRWYQHHLCVSKMPTWWRFFVDAFCSFVALPHPTFHFSDSDCEIHTFDPTCEVRWLVGWWVGGLVGWLVRLFPRQPPLNFHVSSLSDLSPQFAHSHFIPNALTWVLYIEGDGDPCHAEW